MALMVRIIRSLQFRSRMVWRDVVRGVFAASLAIRRRRRLGDEVEDGVTVVVATWNTKAFLEILLLAFRRHTDPAVRLLVVDNASTDETMACLAEHRTWVDVKRLPINVGHGLALDAGVHAARTKTIVCLDVDAFPIAPGWLDAVVPTLDEGCTLAGALSNGYIHPCFMAFRRSHFLRSRYTLEASYDRRRLPRRGRPRGWDAGQLVSHLDPGPHHPIPPTSVVGPGQLGTVFGGVVYHHFYSTRLRRPLQADITRRGITQQISDEVWRASVTRYLGLPED